MEKPRSCQGCPFETSGRGFIEDTINPTASVAILTGTPGNDDVRGQSVAGYEQGQALYQATDPRPLIGKSGFFLANTFLPLASLSRETVSIQSVLKCLPPITKGPQYDQAITHCTHAHLRIPQAVTTLIAHGEDAWHFTQGTTKKALHDWRGYCGDPYDGRRVFAVTDTADCLRDPHARFLTRLDWKKCGRVLRHEWPLPIPSSVIASPTSRAAFVRLLEEALCQPELMGDTEYIPEQQLLTHVGFAWLKDGTVKGFQLEWLNGRATSVERAIFMKYWPRLCETVTMGFWNAKADLPILEKNLGTIPVKIEDPMQAHAVLWPDMDHDLGFVASIYGKYDKMKHLSGEDVLAYHWGDCLELVSIWEALKKEFIHEPGCERKYREQNLKLIPILLDTESRGIRVNQARIEEAIPQYQVLCDEASELASAYVGWPINVGSVQQVMGYLNGVEGYKLKSFDKDIVAIQRSKHCDFDADIEEKNGFTTEYVMERVQQGAHPLLETRVMYATNNQTISHYLTPLRGVGRCYPQINIHTQAGGRHSTTNPPLATLPNDLRNLIIPDNGTVWIGWDWDQQEPRIQRAESGSRILGAAFDQGHDIHTLLVCALYGWEYPQNKQNPHSAPEDEGWRQKYGWEGKDDPRRVFAKTTRYEINYGGTGEQAAKKAVRMGLDRSITKKASQVLMQSDPDLSMWFTKVEKEVIQTRIVRSWGGGRRIFYWMDGMMNVEEMKRQARNFPPQGGGADLYNLTIVEIVEKVPEARFIFGMHDSQHWSVREDQWQSVYPRIKAIATQPRIINGMSVQFPGSFKLTYSDGRTEKI